MEALRQTWMCGVPECAGSAEVGKNVHHPGPLDKQRFGKLTYLEKDENIARAFHVIYNR
jgi:hypothetical protein